MTDTNKDKNKCKCPFCDAELTEVEDKPFCMHCKIGVESKKCGKPIPPEETVCHECGQS